MFGLCPSPLLTAPSRIRQRRRAGRRRSRRLGPPRAEPASRVAPCCCRTVTCARSSRPGASVLDPWDPAMLQPSSIDVRLDRFFRVFQNSRYTHIDPAEQQDELTSPVEPDGDEPFVLHPGEFVLGSTFESVSLPDDLAGRLEGKSSLGRLGLLTHSTAGFIDPGLHRPHHAGAVERRQPADHAVARDEDRAAVPVPAVQPGRAAVRQRRRRLPLPGAAGADAVAGAPELPPGRHPALTCRAGPAEPVEPRTAPPPARRIARGSGLRAGPGGSVVRRWNERPTSPPWFPRCVRRPRRRRRPDPPRVTAPPTEPAPCPEAGALRWRRLTRSRRGAAGPVIAVGRAAALAVLRAGRGSRGSRASGAGPAAAAAPRRPAARLGRCTSPASWSSPG